MSPVQPVYNLAKVVPQTGKWIVDASSGIPRRNVIGGVQGRDTLKYSRNATGASAASSINVASPPATVEKQCGERTRDDQGERTGLGHKRGSSDATHPAVQRVLKSHLAEIV